MRASRSGNQNAIRFATTIVWSLCLALALLWGGTVAARPVLDYSGWIGRDAMTVAPPQTAFHDWQVAEAEANEIVESWKTEPVSIAWTRVQLDRYIKHKASPSRGARGLALMHVAMHDAYEVANTNKLDARLALSMAAARVLSYQFAAEERAFDRIAWSIAANVSKSPRDAIPDEARQALQLGLAVGERVVSHAESDGAQRGWNGARLQWYGDGRYYGPGSWEPTPPYFYYPPDEPFAPSWKAWVLTRNDRFRPVPPAYGSARFIKDLQEVVAVNAALTDDQRRIAKFWVDGHGSVTPPGHWNQIAIKAALQAKLEDAATLDLFTVLNIGLADTFIAVWEAKYHYWTIRPVTAAKKILNIDFTPEILTPPFPSYVAGHAGVSGAASRILGAWFPAQAQRFDAMAEEAALSRLYGGIHYRYDNDDGLALGRKVAQAVLDKMKK